MGIYKKRDLTELPCYSSMVILSQRTGIPLGIVRQAKKAGCPAFEKSRISLEHLLRWIFSQDAADTSMDWGVELRKWQAMREQLKHERESSVLVLKTKVAESINRCVACVPVILEQKLVNEYPAAVAGLDPAQARVYSKRVVDDVLAAFAALGREWVCDV